MFPNTVPRKSQSFRAWNQWPCASYHLLNRPSSIGGSHLRWWEIPLKQSASQLAIRGYDIITPTGPPMHTIVPRSFNFAQDVGSVSIHLHLLSLFRSISADQAYHLSWPTRVHVNGWRWWRSRWENVWPEASTVKLFAIPTRTSFVLWGMPWYQMSAMHYRRDRMLVLSKLFVWDTEFYG